MNGDFGRNAGLELNLISPCFQSQDISLLTPAVIMSGNKWRNKEEIQMQPSDEIQPAFPHIVGFVVLFGRVSDDTTYTKVKEY